MSLQVLLTAGIKQKTSRELSLSIFLTQQKLKAFLQKHILKHMTYLSLFYPLILNFLTILVIVDLAQNYQTKTNFLFLPLNGKENFIFVFEILTFVLTSNFSAQNVNILNPFKKTGNQIKLFTWCSYSTVHFVLPSDLIATWK